jgi:hypothetical protein
VIYVQETVSYYFMSGIVINTSHGIFELRNKILSRRANHPKGWDPGFVPTFYVGTTPGPAKPPNESFGAETGQSHGSKGAFLMTAELPK